MSEKGNDRKHRVIRFNSFKECMSQKKNTYNELLVLLNNQGTGFSDVGTERLIDCKSLLVQQKDLSKVLLLGHKSRIRLDGDQEPTLEVNKGVEVSKNQVNGLGRDDCAISLEGTHVSLEVLEVLDVGSLGVEELVDNPGTVISGWTWVRVALRRPSGPEQALEFHQIQHHTDSVDHL